LLLNPVGLAVAALPGGALLILKYWQPITAFFSGLWVGFTEGLAPLAPMFSAVFGTLGNALAPLRPLWDGLAGTFATVWGWVSRLFAPFQATQQSLTGATQASHGFGAWLAFLVVLAAQLVGKF
jgi:phage-related tail protein